MIALMVAWFLFAWAYAQHEFIMWPWIQEHWHDSFGQFWGIHVAKGLAYDYTAVAVPVSFFLLFVSLWFWTDSAKSSG